MGRLVTPINDPDYKQPTWEKVLLVLGLLIIVVAVILGIWI